MYSTAKSKLGQTVIWVCWFLALLALAWTYGLPVRGSSSGGWALIPASVPDDALSLVGIVTGAPPDGSIFPWRLRGRWRKWTWARYRAARVAYRRVRWAARLARLAVMGAMTMAGVVDLLTRAQLRRHLGALPVLYALLDILQVRTIINRYCPSEAEVDHGTVALVLVLNRLMAPRPLYQVADWLAQTVLAHWLSVPTGKFNDDRLRRTLEVMATHQREIWLDIVQQALVRFDIDLRFIFYDLTALVMQGSYAQSDLADFGFAHNTPSDKRKIKLGMDAAGDSFIPADYLAWSGRTADLATVQENMDRLLRLLERRGWPVQDILIIGDRANLNDELALTYAAKRLKYLAGLQPQRKAHRELLRARPERAFYAHPLTAERRPAAGTFGLPCEVVFKHAGRQVIHQGLVVLSGPMCTAVRQGRAKQLRVLCSQLVDVQGKIGQKRCRSVKEVQARAETRLRRSPVGKLMRVQAYEEADHVGLRWWVDRDTLQQAMQADGRYLLVTNDFRLSPQQMLTLYRAKDGSEKRFEVIKQDLRVRPIYLHRDDRIEGMLLLNMIALLAYSLLEREVRRKGLAYTARQVRDKLESLAVIETHAWDGSVLYRLTPMNEEQCHLLLALAHILAEWTNPRLSPTHLADHWPVVAWQIPLKGVPLTLPMAV